MVEMRSLVDPTVTRRFRAMEKRLAANEVSVEADRCFYCYDAPCSDACPAEIDIPAFIRAISVGQSARAADVILKQNPLGASCARVCPVETLCEEACVRCDEPGGPVRIGLLQQVAMEQLPRRATFSTAVTSHSVAVVGAGPAGMTVSRLLAEAGVSVDLFELRDQAGGLNETGIAAYKMLDDAAQREAEWLLGHPNINIIYQTPLGTEIHLATLRERYREVVLAIGLAGQRRLRVAGEGLPGIFAAVPFIAAIRRGGAVPVGRKALVIGGGMTAVDIAVQMQLLGSEEVHICYRRGIEDMGASAHERQLARDQGVMIHQGLLPVAFQERASGGLGVVLGRLHCQEGVWVPSGESETWEVDQVFIAIGQCLDLSAWAGDSDFSSLVLDERGKIAVDNDGRTSLPGVWAAGDCAGRSADLTVQAVADAKCVVRALLADWQRAAA